MMSVLGHVQERCHAMVLLATFLGLRLGELAGLRRSAVDLDAGKVRVRRVTGQSDSGELFDKDPKSEAGKRWVAIPDVIMPELKRHMAEFAQKGDDGRVFVGPRGGQIRRNNFNRVWQRARDKAGISADAHFHDLRHTGSTLAASTGASLRELMTRMRHFSTRAALRYQHATSIRE